MSLPDFLTGGENYVLTRLVLQRGLALTYVLAFVAVLHQWKPLLGERGLLPVGEFVGRIRFWDSPSLFNVWHTDAVFTFFGWLGFALALFALFGFSEKFGTATSALTWFSLWLIYLSFVNVGQTFYSFGWETLLLEAGFLAIFLGSASTTPSFIVILLFQWLLFRVMFGAGLIKIRGDECWRDLTCLVYHYETQPMPNPLTWYFHHLPVWTHKLGVLVNHVAELVVPFFYFATAPLRAFAGLITFLFHGWLFISGNFAFLGFLTMVLSVSTISDKYMRYVLPVQPQALAPPSDFFTLVTLALGVLVAVLSIAPIGNLFSPRQAMNASFEPLHLVNTYGAFGSITRPRYEVVVEGTDAEELMPETAWREYEFLGKPGDVRRVPPQVAPYHLRLDWLMWFAAFGRPEQHPWFPALLEKFLQGDRGILSLIRRNPFPDKPPTFVRALLYEYRFTTPAERRETGALWRRTLRALYFPPARLTVQPSP